MLRVIFLEDFLGADSPNALQRPAPKVRNEPRTFLSQMCGTQEWQIFDASLIYLKLGKLSEFL
jgi:hypothetical protein